MSKAADAFMTVRTEHSAEVAWWWVSDKLHDTDYHIEVNDSMGRKITELEGKYDVRNNTSYCCQWEGFELISEDKAAVEAAGRELAQHLARFKGIQPLQFD